MTALQKLALDRNPQKNVRPALLTGPLDTLLRTLRERLVDGACE
jgi:hypothetical protein